MTITSSLKFLYIFGRSGLLCYVASKATKVFEEVKNVHVEIGVEQKMSPRKAMYVPWLAFSSCLRRLRLRAAVDSPKTKSYLLLIFVPFRGHN